MYISYYSNTHLSDTIQERNKSSYLYAQDIAALYLKQINLNCKMDDNEYFKHAEKILHRFINNSNLPNYVRNSRIDVITVNTILGKAQNGKILEGLTFFDGHKYIIIISLKYKHSIAKLLLHEFLHVIVDNYNTSDKVDSIDIEEQVEDYLEMIWEEKK